MLNGQGRKAIAADLGISEHTVGDYQKKLHKHFNVSSRAELQAYFFLGGQPQSLEGAESEDARARKHPARTMRPDEPRRDFDIRGGDLRLRRRSSDFSIGVFASANDVSLLMLSGLGDFTRRPDRTPSSRELWRARISIIFRPSSAHCAHFRLFGLIRPAFQGQ